MKYALKFRSWLFLPVGLILAFLTYFLAKTPLILWTQQGIESKASELNVEVNTVIFKLRNWSKQNSSDRLEALEEQNILLKQALVKQQPQSNHAILSHSYKLISTINGVKPSIGSMVLSDGWLLGFVSQSTNYAAKIVLLSDVSTKPIFVSTESGIKGLVRGDGKNLILGEVHQSSLPKAGEKIMTIGQIEYEPNLLIGFVDSKIADLKQGTKQYIVAQPRKFDEINEVEVLEK